MRSSESFTTALVRKAAQSHAGTQLFQNLFREKMTEIDSELRARGMASIAPEDGISVLPLRRATAAASRTGAKDQDINEYPVDRLHEHLHWHHESGVRCRRQPILRMKTSCCLACSVLLRLRLLCATSWIAAKVACDMIPFVR